MSRIVEAIGRFPCDGPAKFNQVKKALAWAVSDIQPGTKLPPVREIAIAGSVTAVPAQRAVMELVREGTLRSAPRSGVFVGARAAARTGEGGANSRRSSAELRNRLVFATDSAWNFQLDFWRGIAKGFESIHPNLELEVRPFTKFPGTGEYDVYERSERLDSDAGDVEEALDVTALMAEQCPDAQVSGRAVALYHRSFYLFLNRPMLRGIGAPEPAYQDFSGLVEYVEEVGRLCLRRGFSQRPVSVCQPMTLLGKETEAFLKAIRSKKARVSDEAIAAWKGVASLTRLFQYIDNGNCGEDFLEGRYPLYHGYGVDLWGLLAKPPAFEWAVYPTLKADNTLLLWPRIGLIPRQSKFPLEASRLLAYLFESGRRFAEIGDIPARPGRYDIPRLVADPDWFWDLVARSNPLCLANPDDRYLANAALNGELWKLIGDRGADPVEAARRAIRLGKACIESQAKADRLV